MTAKASFIGRLGKDPRSFEANGKTFASFPLGVTLRRGKGKKETLWVDVTIFSEVLADTVLQYCQKGSQVYVEGEPTARAYETKDGKAGASLQLTVGAFKGEITLLGSKEDRPEGEEPEERAARRPTGAPKPAAKYEDLDDDIPF